VRANECTNENTKCTNEIEIILFLFIYHSCPYRFLYIDSTSIDTSIAMGARTLLIRLNIVPTKMVADKLRPFSSMPIPVYMYIVIPESSKWSYDRVLRYQRKVDPSQFYSLHRYLPVFPPCAFKAVVSKYGCVPNLLPTLKLL